MDLHQTSSVLDEMSFALSNKDEMVDNVMTVLPIELTNATGTHLHQLNEDCLLEIFSRNPLTPIDLCSVAETCKRFKQITQRMFSKGFTIKPCYTAGRIYTFSSKDSGVLECTFQDTERVLKNFGPHLSEVYLWKDLALVNLVAKYCDDITLNRLAIDSIEGIEGVAQQLSSIFERLLKLYVFNCNVPIESLDMNCDSLIDLEILFCENGAALLSNTFPRLERFIFRSSCRKNHIEALSEFVRRHGCLKIIEICGESFNLSKLLHAISCSCNELVELALDDVEYISFDISHLQNLAKLKILKIGYEGRIQHSHYDEIQFFDVLPRLQGLRELKLENCDNVNDFPWTKLTQLRKVYLINSIVGPYLLDVIRHLINLEELEVGYYFRLEGEEFSKIVKLVECRTHVLTLRCHYNFIDEENCNENRKVKLIEL